MGVLGGRDERTEADRMMLELGRLAQAGDVAGQVQVVDRLLASGLADRVPRDHELSLRFTMAPVLLHVGRYQDGANQVRLARQHHERPWLWLSRRAGVWSWIRGVGATCLTEIGTFDEAVREFEWVVRNAERPEHHRVAQLGMAQIAWFRGDLERAEGDLVVLLGRADTPEARAGTLAYLALVKRDQGDVAAASEFLTSAVEVGDETGLRHALLADVLVASGQLDEARDALQVAHELVAPYHVFLPWYVAIVAARLHLARRDPASAIGQASAAFDRLRVQGAWPYVGLALVEQARAEHALGRRADAVTSYRTAFDLFMGMAMRTQAQRIEAELRALG